MHRKPANSSARSSRAGWFGAGREAGLGAGGHPASSCAAGERHRRGPRSCTGLSPRGLAGQPGQDRAAARGRHPAVRDPRLRRGPAAPAGTARRSSFPSAPARLPAAPPPPPDSHQREAAPCGPRSPGGGRQGPGGPGGREEGRHPPRARPSAPACPEGRCRRRRRRLSPAAGLRGPRAAPALATTWQPHRPAEGEEPPPRPPAPLPALASGGAGTGLRPERSRAGPS